jgi:16S rRNA (guanine527-N7)-methyltransferase
VEREAELLRAEAAAVGVQLGPEAAERLLALCGLVREAPFNLTAVRDPDDMRRKHLVDSLACLPLADLRAGERVLDLGSGAGFPGLPVAIACPEVQMVLVEAVGKKAEFLRRAVERLGVAHACVVQARAEDLGRRAEWRERSDCVLARAVAPLRTLLELALPLCRVGGRLIAFKGKRAEEELAAARGALEVLGGSCTARRELRLPGGGEHRTLLRIEKVAPTPPGYPRRAGVPTRRPL